jgi:dimethylhistidine N-methyltransferase
MYDRGMKKRLPTPFSTARNSQNDRYASILLRTADDDFARDVRAGLTTPVKYLPCKYFYDEAGSSLFEQICELPEYYLPRVETSILLANAAEMIAHCPSPLCLVELGCGNSRKTRLLIDACFALQQQLMFYGIDIAPECLEKGAKRLLDDYPRLRVTGLVGEFADGLTYLAGQSGGPRLVVFLGSTIGNFDEPGLEEFLRMLRVNLRGDDRLLVGVDMLKDPAALVAAYDDAQGVTARFNLNLLARINRELSGDFDLSAFRHRALFNAERSRIEMHMVSLRDQLVRIGALELQIRFRLDETIHTENCYKHSLAGMQSLLVEHGFEVLRPFLDPAQQFCLYLAR